MEEKDNEMNFKTLTWTMAATNCKFIPNMTYMLKTPISVPDQLAHAAVNAPVCSETPHGLAQKLNLAKTTQ